MTIGFVRVRFVDPQKESTLFGPLFEYPEEFVLEIKQKLHPRIAIPGMGARMFHPFSVGPKMDPRMTGPDYCIFYRD